MPVEIREIVVKVRVDESSKSEKEQDLSELRKSILRACKKEIREQIRKGKQR